MGSIIRDPTILLLLVVAATGLIAYLAIYYRKRKQPMQPKAVDEMVSEGAQETAHGGTPTAHKNEAQSRAIEGPQLPGVDGTQPSAPGEAELTRAQEAQPIAEETQAIGTKETEPTATEQAQPQGAEKVQPKGAEEQPEVEVKTGQREPIERGGRPRRSTPTDERTQPPETKPRRPKPEIVCRRRERQWVLAVEAPEELLGNPDLEVLQNESLLSPDELAEASWCLKDVSGEVVVRWSEAGALQEIKIELGQERYLLFKLVGQDMDQGRLERSPTSGSYLVVVPDTWGRDEALSGPPPVMPEPVSLAGYKAHFFDLQKKGDQKIAFCLPDGKQSIIEAKAPRFELLGKQLTDAGEYMGPLFGEEPPRIRALDAQAWKNVKTIVIGEEGTGHGKWRTEFSPDPGQIEQELPSKLADRKSGWYFLRFYDTKNNLLESLDFRFITALKEINVQQPSPFPSKEGHKAVLVEFIHESDCIVQLPDSSTKIKIERKPDRTILTVPPDPNCDPSRWSLCPQNGPAVEVVVLVERIWWALAEEGNASSDPDWTDKLLELSREDFAATSNKALWLRLPKRRWLDKVLVGFERSKARAYKVKVAENTVTIPLRDYSDSSEVENQRQKYPFRVWIERGDRVDEGIVAILCPSQPARCWAGFGRKKNAVARAVIYNGDGEIRVNGELVYDYFAQAPQKAKRFLGRLINLEEVQRALSKLDVNVTVRGSSPTTLQQPKAVAHAVARALTNYDLKLKPLLRQAGFGGVRVKRPEFRRRNKQ